MQPKNQFSSGNLAHNASAPRSPVTQFEELDYSTQAMEPKIQFSSGNLAHKASAPMSPSTQFEELDYSTQAMQPKSQFSSGNLAHKASAPRSPSAQFEELDYSTQAIQLKSQFSSGTSTYKASAQQLSLKSSTTLLRPCSPRVSLAQAFSPRSLNNTFFKSSTDQLRRSIQTMQPRSQFGSYRTARRAQVEAKVVR